MEQLRFSVSLPDTSCARDVHANLRAGNLKECSFGFGIDDPDTDESWQQDSDGRMLRTLKNVRLFDVSVVTSPAYSNTNAQARNIVAQDIQQRMASANIAAETAARAAKASAILTAHSDWQRSQITEDMAVLDEQLRVRLEFLKTL